jgi:hypothetical protein
VDGSQVTAFRILSAYTNDSDWGKELKPKITAFFKTIDEIIKGL